VASPAPLPNSRIPPREPATVQITRQLVDYLSSGAVQPGQRLPGERALSDALGIGRAALREAIKSLIFLGLLEQRQGDGTYLARGPSDLLPRVIDWGILLQRENREDLIEARLHLEVTLAGLAARNRTPEQLERLRAVAAEMRDAGLDFSRYIEADVHFHLQIAEASGNAILAGVLGNIRSLLHVWTERVIIAAQETETSLAVHLPVLEAIERQDVDDARVKMQALIERASRRLRAAIDSEEQAAIDRQEQSAPDDGIGF
jgi:GntR family transcriptional repressor for pyruvate dehydrogenase complex